MPDRPRPGMKGVYIELPEALHARMAELARGNGRTFKVEVVRALERYLQAPDRVVPSQDPEPVAPPEPSAEKPKRGRKRKGCE